MIKDRIRRQWVLKSYRFSALFTVFLGFAILRGIPQAQAGNRRCSAQLKPVPKLSMPPKSFRTMSSLIERLKAAHGSPTQLSSGTGTSLPTFRELSLTLAYSPRLGNLFLTDYIDLLLAQPASDIAETLPLLRIFNDSIPGDRIFEELKEHLLQGASESESSRWNAAWVLSSPSLEAKPSQYAKLLQAFPRSQGIQELGLMDLVVHLSRDSLRPLLIQQRGSQGSPGLWLGSEGFTFLDSFDDQDFAFADLYWRSKESKVQNFSIEENKDLVPALIARLSSPLLGGAAAVSLIFLRASAELSVRDRRLLGTSVESKIESVMARAPETTSLEALKSHFYQAQKLLKQKPSARIVDTTH